MSQSQPIVDAKQVSKKYCRQLKRSLWYGIQDLGSELRCASRQQPVRLRRGEFFALRNVSFKVMPGECIALLGPNGAGKSTMMKLLNGLLKPDAGEIRIRGKIGALIELGTGFNPLLSGRENVYINGAVLGLGRREIDARFDEILEFSELGDFINAPVKSYSSGMRVRLGYSVAAHLKPNLLLLDEVLAVGDVGFRMKCFAHLAKIRDQGTSIILVSHAMGALSRVAQRAVVFGSGKLAYDGPLEGGISTYQELVGLEKQQKSSESSRPDDSVCEIADVETLNEKGEATREFQTGDKLRLRMNLKTEGRLPHARIIVQLESPVSGPLFGISSYVQDFRPTVESPGRIVEFELPELPLRIGSFHFNITLYGEENTELQHRVNNVGSFRIVAPELGPPGFGDRGILKTEYQWTDVGAPD